MKAPKPAVQILEYPAASKQSGKTSIRLLLDSFLFVAIGFGAIAWDKLLDRTWTSRTPTHIAIIEASSASMSLLLLCIAIRFWQYSRVETVMFLAIFVLVFAMIRFAIAE